MLEIRYEREIEGIRVVFGTSLNKAGYQKIDDILRELVAEEIEAYNQQRRDYRDGFVNGYQEAMRDLHEKQ